MDIVVRGRNVEVPDHFRQHVSEKLARVERFDQKMILVDVELHHERNPRQANACQRVEITCKSRGPVVRAEASAADFYSALDLCIAKLDRRMRRAADRRRVHHGSRTPKSVAAATVAATVSAAVAADRGREEVGALAPFDVTNGTPVAAGSAVLSSAVDYAAEQAGESDGYEPGRIVREKEHPAKPMSLGQALFEMELVGHDFYLFSDAETGQPSVVYRRKGYDYGVIRLVS